MSVLNIVNLKIENEKLIFEFTLERENISEDIQTYMETDTNKRYQGKLTKVENRLKSIIEVPIEKDFLRCKIYENGNIKDAEILDNKNEEIVQEGNKYEVFYKNKVIQVSKNGINITQKYLPQKFNYELFKIVYGIKKFKRLYLLRMLKGKNKYYLFNDRLMYADDNAEELFRYINKNDKKFARKCYFVLDKNSNKFQDIKKVGNVLKYGSLKHKLKYINAKMVISSHASYSDNMFNPFGYEEMQIYKDIITKKFVFLQHGIIMNDVSDILNRSHIIADIFITSMKREYDDILTSKYLYDKSQVVCTGLARFDKLIDNKEKIILIAPTWRTTLMDELDFETSEYYNKFKSILNNKTLNDMLIEKGYKVYFLVHPAFEKYKESFQKLKSEYVRILIANEVNYSELFSACSIFITDYSSTHFDVAVLQKPIIYYQFDKEEFFEKHYQVGYFGYEKDGFGEVIDNEDELVNKISYYVLNDCQIEKTYCERIKSAFAYTDMNNSKRILEVIRKIDKDDLNYRFNNVH